MVAHLPALSKLAYDTQETANLLGISKARVRQLAHDGRLRVIWTSCAGAERKHFIVPAGAIEAFLAGEPNCQSRGGGTGSVSRPRAAIKTSRPF